MATASVTNTLVDGSTPLAAIWNTNYQDLVTFLNSSVVHVDGSKAMSGNLAMGSNKVTGLAAPTVGTDATTKTYVDAEVTAAEAYTDSEIAALDFLSVGSDFVRAGTVSDIPGALTASYSTEVSVAFTMPAGWSSALVLVWGEIMYAGVSDGLQLTSRMVIDTSNGGTAQGGAANSSNGTSGVIHAAPKHSFTTSEGTVNMSLQAYKSAGGTWTAAGKYANLAYVAFKAS